jgi:hypothetical protein
MGITFANNGSTTLNGGINTVVDEIVVDSTASFPTIGNGSSNGDFFYATLIAQDGTREVVKVLFLTGSTYTVIRAQDGTGVTPDVTGYTFSDEDRFQLRFPKIILEEFRDDIDVNTTDLAGTTNPATIPAPSGTRLWFYQSAAPATWTIYTTVEDCLLAVKDSGASHYASNIGDGVEAGSAWNAVFAHKHTMNSHTHEYPHSHGQVTHFHTMPSHTHTMNSHYHSMPSHNHTMAHTHSVSGTTSQMGQSAKEQGSNSNNVSPDNHTHTFSVTSGGSSASNTGSKDPGDTNATDPGDANSRDPGDTHSKDAGQTNSQSIDTTSSIDPGDTNSTTQPSADRPLAAVGILATKD